MKIEQICDYANRLSEPIGTLKAYCYAFDCRLGCPDPVNYKDCERYKYVKRLENESNKRIL